MRKPGSRVSDQFHPKLGNIATEDGKKLGFRNKSECTIYVAKRKVLIRCAYSVDLCFHKKQVFS